MHFISTRQSQGRDSQFLQDLVPGCVMLFLLVLLLTWKTRHYLTDFKYKRLAFLLVTLNCFAQYSIIWLVYCISEIALLIMFDTRSLNAQVSLTSAIALVFAMLKTRFGVIFYGIIVCLEAAYFGPMYLLQLGLLLSPAISLCRFLILPALIFVTILDEQSALKLIIALYREVSLVLVLVLSLSEWSSSWYW